MTRAAVLAAVVALTAILPPSALARQATPAAGPSVAGPADAALLYDAVLPDVRQEIEAETAGVLPVYVIEAVLSPMPAEPDVSDAAAVPDDASPAAGPDAATPAAEPAAEPAPAATIAGDLSLRYVNATGADLREVYFRLYPNHEWYAEGGIDVRDVTADGKPVAAETSVNGTVLRVPLPAALAPGEITDIAMAFTTAVPTQPGDQVELFSFDPDRGTYQLAYWHPLLAGYHPETGWYTEEVSPYGDPLVADSALYDVTLTAPAGLVVAAAGREVSAQADGDAIRHRYVTGPAREFVLAADATFASASRDVGGTTVTAYYDPDLAEGGEAMLDFAADILAVYNDMLGAYPYAELDLVGTTMVNWSGFEFSQLVFIENGYLANYANEFPAGSLEFVVAHELAHQWWYGLVGSDQQQHAFLDEGLTEYTAIVYLERQHGPEAAERQEMIDASAYAFRYAAVGDLVVDQPSAEFPGPGSYADAVYSKGMLGFAALRAEIGDEVFFAALRDYADRERFGIATPADLRAAFERAAGRDLSAFWHAWFDSASTAVELDLLTPFGAPATPASGTPAATPAA